MSAAAAVVPAVIPATRRNITRGFVPIPNSLIENQAILTHAELRLTLLVLRRGGASEAVTVSDRNWQSWTGLSPRLKEYAIAGLKVKCLKIIGRGETAKYSFNPQAWESFVHSHPGGGEHSRPHTAGRKAVQAKPKQKIHPECRARGCALLCPDEKPESPLLLSQIAQPVAQPGTSGGGNERNFSEVNGSPKKGVQKEQNSGSASVPSPNAQPVAQAVSDGPSSAAGFVETLKAVRSYFPLVGLLFLARLVATVRALYADISDGELARAVRAAYRGSSQKTEGLFLQTVPDAIAGLRRLQPPEEAPKKRKTMKNKFLSTIKAVRARGAPFEPLAGEMALLLGEFMERYEENDMAKPGLDAPYTGRADAELARLEFAFVDLALPTLSAEQELEVSRAVEKSVSGQPGMSVNQRVSFRRGLEVHEVLRVLGVPRFRLHEFESS